MSSLDVWFFRYNHYDLSEQAKEDLRNIFDNHRFKKCTCKKPILTICECHKNSCGRCGGALK
jgi:hypothetical protein